MLENMEKNKFMKCNQVLVMGKVNAGFVFSHQVFGERFYITETLVKRLSGAEDKIPVMVSDYLLDISMD